MPEPSAPENLEAISDGAVEQPLDEDKAQSTEQPEEATQATEAQGEPVVQNNTHTESAPADKSADEGAEEAAEKSPEDQSSPSEEPPSSSPDGSPGMPVP